MILTKFLIYRVSAESTGVFLQKVFSPPLLAAVFNFCIKHKNPFILEMERDRAISTKNSPASYFPKNRFHVTFGGHFEFLCKTQKIK